MTDHPPHSKPAGEQPGPCVICGATDYSLSMGGPTICPKCDCGNFDAATVMAQAKVIAALRAEIEALRAPAQQVPEPAHIKRLLEDLLQADFDYEHVTSYGPARSAAKAKIDKAKEALYAAYAHSGGPAASPQPSQDMVTVPKTTLTWLFRRRPR